MSVYLLINNSLNLNKLNLIKCNSSALCRRIALCKKERLVLQKKYSKILFPSGKKIYYILVPMKISESIEAHLSTAVAAISQRNQATLPGFHKILISHVIKIFNRLAKASGFCLYFIPCIVTALLSTVMLSEAKHPDTNAAGLDPSLRDYVSSFRMTLGQASLTLHIRVNYEQ